MKLAALVDEMREYATNDYASDDARRLAAQWALRLDHARRDYDKALDILSPVCDSESVTGAIRNVQQAAVGWQDLAAEYERRLKRTLKALRVAMQSVSASDDCAPWLNAVLKECSTGIDEGVSE